MWFYDFEVHYCSSHLHCLFRIIGTDQFSQYNCQCWIIFRHLSTVFKVDFWLQSRRTALLDVGGRLLDGHDCSKHPADCAMLKRCGNQVFVVCSDVVEGSLLDDSGKACRGTSCEAESTSSLSVTETGVCISVCDREAMSVLSKCHLYLHKRRYHTIQHKSLHCTMYKQNDQHQIIILHL